MAADRPRIVSLPGDSASSARLVTRPYPTATSAQTSATTTPWSVRNSDKETSLEATWKATKDGDRGQAAAERAGSLSGASTLPSRLLVYWPGIHSRPERCAGPGSPGLGGSEAPSPGAAGSLPAAGSGPGVAAAARGPPAFCA